MAFRRQVGKQAGLTLIELMVAVALVFLLSAVVIPSYRDYLATSRQQAMITQAAQFHLFQQAYRVDTGSYGVGTYDPKNNTNTFLALAPPLSFRMQESANMFRFVTAKGSCASLTTCYELTITDGNVTGTWNSVADRWTWSD